MSVTTTSRARPTVGLIAAALALGPLAGCTLSSENVSCTTSSCSVTLEGDGAEAKILGTTLAFGGVQDGRASLSVGSTEVSCSEGESVSAGPLDLECSSVTEDSVELTASLG
jgi:hypothetical protein